MGKAVAGIATALAVAAVGVSAASGGTGGTGPPPASGANPCLGPLAQRFLCPDLLMAPPHDMYADPREHPGRVLLRATNNIRSRGTGPIELRAHRYRPNWMRANQRIYKVGGGSRTFRTRALIHFFNVGSEYGGSFWKVRFPARFELWSLDRRRHLDRIVRSGPKQFYCFRDLVHTAPGMQRSPNEEVYPGCNQNPKRRHVVLGTSVGWSDIYPSPYDRQWIDVTGLRGCFAYVLIVDPRNLFYESNELNNRSKRIVRLPYRDGPQNC